MSNRPFWFSVIRQSCYHGNKVFRICVYRSRPRQRRFSCSITGQCMYIHMDVFRAVFNRVSKVIHVCFGRFKFFFATFCDWLENFAPLNQPMRSQTKTTVGCCFPELITGDKCLLRALIGSWRF